MPLFNVHLEGTVVIYAGTSKEAWDRCHAFVPGLPPEISAVGAQKIQSENDLENCWEPEYRPYGLESGDYRSIRQILQEEEKPCAG